MKETYNYSNNTEKFIGYLKPNNESPMNKVKIIFFPAEPNEPNEPCSYCGISSFAYIHEPNTKPKDFIIIEESPMNKSEEKIIKSDELRRIKTLYYPVIDLDNGGKRIDPDIAEANKQLDEFILEIFASREAGIIEMIKGMKLKNANSIDKLEEVDESVRIANLLNENMVFGFQTACLTIINNLTAKDETRY